VLLKLTQLDDCGDYESELAVVIGKTAKNVSEADALDYALGYTLGYTAANDRSSRTSQLAQSWWLLSKGFDSACPIVVSCINLPVLSCGNTPKESLREGGEFAVEILPHVGTSVNVFKNEP